MTTDKSNKEKCNKCNHYEICKKTKASCCFFQEFDMRNRSQEQENVKGNRGEVECTRNAEKIGITSVETNPNSSQSSPVDKCQCEEAKKACILLNRMNLFDNISVLCKKCNMVWGINNDNRQIK